MPEYKAVQVAFSGNIKFREVPLTTVIATLRIIPPPVPCLVTHDTEYKDPERQVYSVPVKWGPGSWYFSEGIIIPRTPLAVMENIKNQYPLPQQFTFSLLYFVKWIIITSSISEHFQEEICIEESIQIKVTLSCTSSIHTPYSSVIGTLPSNSGKSVYIDDRVSVPGPIHLYRISY